jgi:hypothetical protein
MDYDIEMDDAMDTGPIVEPEPIDILATEEQVCTAFLPARCMASRRFTG